MDAEDVEQAVRLMSEALRPLVTHDWSAVAGTLDWNCRETLTHIGHELLAYAAQLSGRAEEACLPLDPVIRDDAAVSDVLAVVEACGGLLAAALRAAGPENRSWDSGPCDASDFAALGVAEILIHTYDITQGLNVRWRPHAAEHSAAVLARLAPEAQPDRRHPTGVLLPHGGRLGDVGPWRWRVTPE